MPQLCMPYLLRYGDIEFGSHFNLVYSKSRVLNIVNDDSGIFNAQPVVYVYVDGGDQIQYGGRRPCSKARLTTTAPFFVVGNFR